MPGKKTTNEAQNAKTMRRARLEKALDEEIALLRVKLQTFTASAQPDEGLILSAINTLGRSLMTQARTQVSDPTETSERMAAVIRQLGVMLEEDHQA